jgi:FKBP-type peptidyl-prolyl cis-trans isomerase SlyD
MVVDTDKVVTITYQLFSLGKGQSPVLLEERSVDDPLEFLYGQGVLLPKVEEALKGKSHGYQVEVNLHPRDAFGLHRAELQTWMRRDLFPKDPELQLGMKFQTQGPEGSVISVIVKELQEDQVLVDGNHPLAGLSLRFDLKILRVREATETELLKKEVDPTHLH